MNVLPIGYRVLRASTFNILDTLWNLLCDSQKFTEKFTEENIKSYVYDQEEGLSYGSERALLERLRCSWVIQSISKIKMRYHDESFSTAS